jgi:transposase
MVFIIFNLSKWKEIFMTQKSDEKKRSDLAELIRKERALSETAALLVLKKKLALIWGEDGDA